MPSPCTPVPHLMPQNSNAQPTHSPLELSSLPTSHRIDNTVQNATEHHSGREYHSRPSFHTTSTSEDKNGGAVAPQRSDGFITRVWRSVMSRAPLMTSSSALGTSSYGALPVHPRHGSYSSSDEEERDRRSPSRTDVSRIQSEHGVASDHGHHANPRKRVPPTPWRRRRSSSMGSEINMGPDSKTSFGLSSAISEEASVRGARNIRSNS
jgi:hypothetical protein